MKIAKLPNGDVLHFPDEVEDEHIDAAVQKKMKGQAEKKAKEEQSSKDADEKHTARHGELIEGLEAIAQMLDHLIKKLDDGHLSVIDAMKENTKAVLLPRKKEIIRDDKGKMTGVHEHV